MTRYSAQRTVIRKAEAETKHASQELGKHVESSSLASRTSFVLLAIVAAATFAVPKAGVKIGTIPITVGNILLGVLLMLCLLAFLAGGHVKKLPLTSLILFSVSYFAVRMVFSAVAGLEIIDYSTSLVIAPLVFLAVTTIVTNQRRLDVLVRIATMAFFFVTIYALLQVAFGINQVAIPGLTVNLTDYQSGPNWYLDKNNAVGSFSKIVSTYQNGNVFGVNLLLLFPIVNEVLKPRWRAVALALFVVVGILTLSRSVWLGIGLYLLFQFLLTRPKSGVGLLARIMGVFGLIASVPIVLVAFPQISARYGDTTSGNVSSLSGRTPGLIDLIDSTITHPNALIFGPYGLISYQGTAGEVTYGAVYMVSGLIGLVLFVLILIRAITTTNHSKNRLARGARLAIAIYGVVSLVEGAFWLPPTSILMWLIIGIGAVGAEINPQEDMMLNSIAIDTELHLDRSFTRRSARS